jgi:glutathione S-transferase
VVDYDDCHTLEITMIKLYDFPISGHAHKVRLMLSLLDLDYERHEVALGQGEQNSEQFLKINPFHHVPVLEDNGHVIRDSNAIIAYLARQYDPKWYPSDAISVARVQEWLAIATKELADGPAAARLVNVFNATLDHQAAIENSHTLLDILDAHLKGRQWVATIHPSIADISLYTYIAHAPEGGVSLASYRNVQSWLTRIEQLPGFVGMPKTAVGLAAD